MICMSSFNLIPSTALIEQQDSPSEQWKGGAAPPLWAQRTGVHRTHQSLPTIEQRARVFKLLATLTGHHTRFCLRKAQKTYKRQVYERYEPLVGYERKGKRRGAMGLLGGLVPKVARRGYFKEAKETEIEQIFSSNDAKKRLRANYDGHRYFFAINLVSTTRLVVFDGGTILIPHSN